MESKHRPKILIANDDGYQARGLRELALLAQEYGDVYVVAPDAPQSAKSSALSFNVPLTMTEHAPIGEARVWSVSGTPVDCIKVGMHVLFAQERPALVLSGINHGSNAAINNIYSGTMGAAMEGCILGIPSVGFSLLSHDPEADFSHCTEAVRLIISRVLERGLPEGVCLNVNFPKVDALQGLKTVRAAKGYWTEEYADYRTPMGEPFYWLTGRFHNLEPDNAETDEYWLARGCGTIVPVRPDQTAHDSLEAVGELLG